jgi:hypothetical protein
MRLLTKLFDAARQLARHTGRHRCYVCEVELGTLTTRRMQPVCTVCWVLTPDYAEHLRSVERAIRALH